MHTGLHNVPWRRRERVGFTLVELLVVMGVILVLVVMTLPAFQAIQKSGRLSGAINAVTNTLNNARAQAVREGRDVAVMFRFDTRRQVCSMEVLRAEGVVYDAGNDMTAATVFIAIKGQAPVDLPRGAGVYGYGYGASRDRNNQVDAYNWYEDLGSMFRYSGSTSKDPWLFPRTDVRIFADDGPPTDRHVKLMDTFIIRFSPEGTVVTNAEELGSLAAGGNSFLELDPPDDNSNRYFFWNPELRPSGNLLDETVHAEYQLRSVPMLAIVDLQDLSTALGIQKPWMVVGDGMPTSNDYKNTNGAQTPPDQIEINDWIDANATPISFNRFTGELMRDIKR